MRELLNEEVNNKLEALAGLDIDSTKYTAAVTNVKNLMETAVKFEQTDIEWSKVEFQKQQEAEKAKQAEIERSDRLKQQEDETEQQKKQQKSEKIRGWFQIGLVALGTIASIVLPIWGTIVDQNREREGEMVTSDSGKRHRNGLFSKK